MDSFLKPGNKTTEFVVTVVVVLLNVLGVVLGYIDDPKWAALAMAASAGCYAIARGLAKSSGVNNPLDPGAKK